MSYNLIPNFATKEETFAYIAKNEKAIDAQKKAIIKFGNPSSGLMYVNSNGDLLTTKSFNEFAQKELSTENLPISVKAIINTTNLLDSHGDVHIKGIWKQSLKLKKQFSLCKEHRFSFDGTITDDVKAYTETKQFSELGEKYDGDTECLVFNAIIQPDDETGMYKRYKKGVVKNHSVGMQYVKYYVCMNTDAEEYAQYKANWDKYISHVANQDDALKQGYFWAVTEAKIIEGSAVKAGSNWVTPTESVTEVKEINIDDNTNTENEPPISTHSQSKSVPDLFMDFYNN